MSNLEQLQLSAQRLRESLQALDEQRPATFTPVLQWLAAYTLAQSELQSAMVARLTESLTMSMQLTQQLALQLEEIARVLRGREEGHPSDDDQWWRK